MLDTGRFWITGTAMGSQQLGVNISLAVIDSGSSAILMSEENAVALHEVRIMDQATARTHLISMAAMCTCWVKQPSWRHCPFEADLNWKAYPCGMSPAHLTCTGCQNMHLSHI